MDTQSLKISLAQRILSISDNNLLEKLKKLIEKENVIGFDAKGNAITERQYLKEIDKLINDIDAGKEKLFTTDEVLKIITNENNLDK